MRFEDYIDQFGRRLIQDAMTQATAAHWRRRAAEFAAVGNERCDEIARACTARAQFEQAYPSITEAEIVAMLDEMVA